MSYLEFLLSSYQGPTADLNVPTDYPAKEKTKQNIYYLI